jgi:hypothetical protein
MKKIIYLGLLLLAVLSGLVYAYSEVNKITKPSSKTVSVDQNMALAMKARAKWETSPAGMYFKEWERSPQGIKVHASHDKIRKEINAFSDMDAIVTSVTFKREGVKSAGPKWIIVKIKDDEYMMQYNLKDFEQLKSLKVNDKIIIKSRNAGYSPNHPYLILSGDYIERNKTVLFKRDFSNNGGC